MRASYGAEAPAAQSKGPGWSFLPASQLPRVTSDVLVESHLRDALIRLNPEVTARPDRADEVLSRLRATEEFTAWPRGERSMPFEPGGEHTPVRLVDFEPGRDNRCLVVTQLVFTAGSQMRAVTGLRMIWRRDDDACICTREGRDQMMTRAAVRSAQDALVDAQRTLGQRPDVLRVRLGWVFRDGWITDERALVVTVRRKLTPAELQAAGRELLPETFQGLPVEVTGPTPEDLLRLVYGPELVEDLLAESTAAASAIRYAPPADVKLRRYTARMRVAAHVSPDAGWRELAAFLGPTRRQLIVGMYDFGARHIVAALQAVGQRAGFAKLTLVMQKGASIGHGTKTDDLDDAEVVETLRETLAERFAHAWVRIGAVNGWVASSYHIKVAVRDERAAWLSSGNWQSSNQPPADPLAEQPPDRKWLTRYNREWHVVIEHAGLSRTLAAYLRHDYEHNLGAVRTVAEELPAWPELLVAEQTVATSLDAAATWRYFPPYDVLRRVTVRPLLTPDNYHRHVLALVRGAREELLIQNQTFKAPKAGEDALRALVDAVIARQRVGVRVKIIFRTLLPAQTRLELEQLKDYGLDLADVKVQVNCHTKGIVVDRRRVLIGSQNWSNHGVSVNRDASLLFDDGPLAEYFADIFEHDWNNLAQPRIGSEWELVEVAVPGAATPPGMVRLARRDYDAEV